MRRSRSARVAFTFAWVLTLAPRAARAQAQPGLPMRALELEQAGQWREALSAYRAALDESTTAAILGIERVYDQLGKRDSILPLIDSLITKRPREPMLRTVQLRTFAYLHRDEAGEAASDPWVPTMPSGSHPPTPCCSGRSAR
jgi:hypothetical protein